MQNFSKKYYPFLLLFITASSITALIPDAYASRIISSPYVKGEKWIIENHGSYAFDEDNKNDRSLKSRLRIGYGISNYIRPEININLSDTHGESLDFSTIQPAIKFQLSNKKEYFFDFGAKLKYSFTNDKNNGRADKIGSTIYLGKEIDSLIYYTNFSIDRETGSNRTKGTELAINQSVSKKISDNTKITLEYYSDFDELSAGNSWEEQNHQIGLSASFDLKDQLKKNVKMTIGALQGITNNSPDQTIKWELKLNF